jgi:glucose-1-phosphate adenylyltransferase
VPAFLEKPREGSAPPTKAPLLLASMRSYLFRGGVLREVLGEDALRRSTHDFGHDILPSMLGRYRVVVFPFVEGIGKAPAYWRDVGTIDAYWEAHLDLVGRVPASGCLRPTGRCATHEYVPSHPSCRLAVLASARREG